MFLSLLILEVQTLTLKNPIDETLISRKQVLQQQILYHTFMHESVEITGTLFNS